MSPAELKGKIQTVLGPIAPAGRFEFRVGDEIASLVNGVAYAGPIDDPDVVVEGDAEGLYYLFIERRLDGVSITGDRALLAHLIHAAPQPNPASPNRSSFSASGHSSSSRNGSEARAMNCSHIARIIGVGAGGQDRIVRSHSGK